MPSWPLCIDWFLGTTDTPANLKKMSDATKDVTENVANLQLDAVTGEMVSKS